MRDILGMLRRGLRKPPRVIVRRILSELSAELERFSAPRRQRISLSAILSDLGETDLSSLWKTLGQTAYPAMTHAVDAAAYDALCPGGSARILQAAARAMGNQVDLLGSGMLQLGAAIDWHADFKTGIRWAPQYFRSIEYNNLDRPSDVKSPWELSRMQWLMPVGQAYLLTQDERYADKVKHILDHWIDNNPYASSVNWACTMDVALRILTWTWFFHVFKDSASWQDAPFREKFIRALYLHADFTSRHLEKSDVNGNHFTADAAGLVFAGRFFGARGKAAEWDRLGWDILCDEFPRQVFNDGVDYEASVPYHRLVLELFFFPALYRMKAGISLEPEYHKRLLAMGEFTEAYARDGMCPLWGDADDARALPFGTQAINDHRYLLDLLSTGLGAASYRQDVKSALAADEESFWWFGHGAARSPSGADIDRPLSRAFPDGGFYVMRNTVDHVFVDCGPLGLAGRGGHGHNDILSFEAVLDGQHLVSDAGAYLYTADYRQRNLFRSTAYHNTPRINGEEINRFIRPDYLWNLHNDAQPQIHQWTPGAQADELVVSHSGYERMHPGLRPVRRFVLDHRAHSLSIEDSLENLPPAGADWPVEIPLLLAPGVSAHIDTPDAILLEANGKHFRIDWLHDEDCGRPWQVTVEAARVSPSYGVVLDAQRVIWRGHGRSGTLRMTIRPC